MELYFGDDFFYFTKISLFSETNVNRKILLVSAIVLLSSLVECFKPASPLPPHAGCGQTCSVEPLASHAQQ